VLSSFNLHPDGLWRFHRYAAAAGERATLLLLLDGHHLRRRLHHRPSWSRETESRTDLVDPVDLIGNHINYNFQT
jgi:hypothetical protein